MCFRCKIALILGLCGASWAHADQAEISLSERAAEFDYARAIDASAADISAGLFFNEESDLMLNGGLVVSGQPPGELPFSFGAGAKAYVAGLDDPDEDIAAIALGGRVGYTIPANIPLHLTAQGFYAPSITAFSGADNLLDFITRFEVEFIPRTTAFVGYRFLQTDLEDGRDVELDDNIHIGLRLNF
jgi:hypothetical protein